MDLTAFGGVPATDAPAPKPPRKSRAKTAIMDARASEPAPAPTLADDVSTLEATLGRSLGVKPGPNGYSPAEFVGAIQAVHDRLVQVRCDLAQRQAELDAREAALEAAIEAVQAREARVEGILALERLCQPAPNVVARRSIMGRMFGG